MLTVEADPRQPSLGTRDIEATFGFDGRCGGLEMLGYKCLARQRPAQPPEGVPPRVHHPRHRGVQQGAVRVLHQRRAQQPRRQADRELVDEHWPATREPAQGQSCSNLAGITACMWNPDFEPRLPETLTK
jgi:hypothetical protein